MRSRPAAFGGAPIASLAMVLTIALHQPTGALHAQQHPSTTIAGLETIRIRANVSVIFGAGANVTVQDGEDGLVLVDSGSTDLAGRLLQAVRAISPRPIRLIVNTSAERDHVGGNGVLAARGTPLSPDPFSGESRATILAHENVLLRMSAPTGQVSPFPPATWPTETFTSRFRSMYVNGEAVQVIRQNGARTDGDVMVLFRTSDVVVTGDIIDLRHFPTIDRAKGGSIQRELEALNRLLTELVVQNIPQVLKPGGTLVVPGHGYVCDYGEVVEYRDMLTAIADIIEDMLRRNMSLEQVKAANPTRGYRVRYGAESGSWTTDMFVAAVYDSLKGARP